MPIETEEEWTCTCHVKDGDEGHEGWCELFQCDDWMDGYVTWFDGELVSSEEIYGWGTEPVVEIEVPATPTSSDDASYECTCQDIDDATVTFQTKHTAMCQLQEHKAWVAADCEWDHQKREFVYYHKEKKTSSQYSGGWGSYDQGGWGNYAKSCTHDGTKALEFPDGTKVYPASSYDTKKRESYPDYALYLETSRYPVSVATYIPWKDYGLPEIGFHAAADTIIETFRIAKSGLTVEIGCIGAHGRTGTVLACMAILAGIPLEDSINWVRTNHCISAVEGEKQRWWVEWFDAYVHGTEAPPTPPVPPPAPPAQKSSAPQATVLPFSTNALGSPPPTAQVGTDRGDLVIGDPCPRCDKSKLIKFGSRLACNNQACDGYQGLLQCSKCMVSLDAQPLNDYLCWNLHCSNFNIKASSPAGKKNRFKKGRKK